MKDVIGDPFHSRNNNLQFCNPERGNEESNGRTGIHASETLAVRVAEEQRMERNENVRLRWMCGVTLRDKVLTVELRRRLGIEVVVEVMRRGRFR